MAMEGNQSKQPRGFDSPHLPLHLGITFEAKQKSEVKYLTCKAEIFPGDC